jgi:hypothetical protein
MYRHMIVGNLSCEMLAWPNFLYSLKNEHHLKMSSVQMSILGPSDMWVVRLAHKLPVA